MLCIFRGSSEQISSAGRLVTTLANSIEAEQVKKQRVTQSRGGVPARTKNLPSTGVRPPDNEKTKPQLSASSCASVELEDCHPPLPRVQESSAVPVDGDDTQSKLEQAAVTSSVGIYSSLFGTSRIPSVKEYSLFDNHFSKAVESVLKNDLCVSGARNTGFTATPPVAAASCPSVDEVLLAKAPGYRASTASPCNGRFLAERPRKYSNDSSSSLSSAKSCEDSPSGHILPPSHLARSSHHIQDIPCSLPFHTVHDLPTKSAPPCPPLAYSDFYRPVEAVSEPVDESVPTVTSGSHTVAEQYSSPNEPMTLPRISTDLNPNAPDFVFRPSAQFAAMNDDVSTSSSTSPDVLTLSTTTAADSSGGGYYIPVGMVEATTSRWNGPAVTKSRSLVTTTIAYDSSMPILDVDVSPRQWPVPNTLLQESLTFG